MFEVELSSLPEQALKTNKITTIQKNNPKIVLTQPEHPDESDFEIFSCCVEVLAVALESFSVAYDEKTGLLSGATNVNFYSILGSDKEYKEQNISGVQMGTNNIFGTRTVPENE